MTTDPHAGCPVAPPSRRTVIRGLAATAISLAASPLAAAEWTTSLGYPDPRVRVLDPAGASLRTGIAKVEQLATGFNFIEGPVWFGDQHALVFSDLGNNRLYRWNDLTGEAEVFRTPSNYVNGNAKDREGRLISCEQLNRRVVRTEHDGSITAVAESFEGKRLNSPNDVIVRSDGSIWFSDPANGITNDYEGRRAEQEQANTNVFRVDPESGEITAVITDIRPNGLCFSHDETKLYVTNGAMTPRGILVYDVSEDGATVSNPRPFITHEKSSADGIKCDWKGNIWASWGAGDGESGVRVFSPEGVPLLQIDLPERAANLYFGGEAGNRLFMTAQQSLYSVYVGTRGATLI
ncbi:MAG TPA: SMP-30/gluconolactonase/LRE family protein [Devosia sp.]|nr:SMP-30/gluconolactonase/LRE family protein [Devosia sp.]